MKTIQLKSWSQARIWVEEDPFDGSRRPSSAAVELLVPRGPRSEYGLLGATVKPGLRHTVSIACQEDAGAWRESLAGAVDEVRRGLPAEYRESVEEGGRIAIRESRLDAPLSYEWAAHGAVGSSPAMLGRLAGTVVKLLDSRTRLDDDDFLYELLEDTAK
jgi:hypothetical protein